MIDTDIKQFEELRERMGDSMHKCETDQLRYYTEALYQECEPLIAEVKAMRAYLRFINEYNNYMEFRPRLTGEWYGKEKEKR
mgnify:FL=1